MIIYGDGKLLLGPVLTYYILVQKLMYILRLILGLYPLQRLG